MPPIPHRHRRGSRGPNVPKARARRKRGSTDRVAKKRPRRKAAIAARVKMTALQNMSDAPDSDSEGWGESDCALQTIQPPQS